MTKKIGGKKLGQIKSTSVSSTKAASEVGRTEAIKEVSGVKPASEVGAVRSSSGVGKRRATRVLSRAEREQLFQIINEEADKLVCSGALPKEKKELITKAVKMSVDAGILEDKD